MAGNQPGAAIFFLTVGGFASFLFVVPWFIQGNIKKVSED